MGSREGMLLVKAWLLKLQSRSRIRRLKLSGTVQGLVQEPAAFDGRTMEQLALARPRRAALARVLQSAAMVSDPVSKSSCVGVGDQHIGIVRLFEAV